jgi:mannose-6-phosphate isomerase
MLTPLKFNTQYFEKIWGGQKLRTLMGKDFGTMANCGESWEVSGIAGKESEVAAGLPLEGNTLPELVEVYMGDLVGEKVYDEFGNDFPLLVKFIDAQDDLSVQVHPDDALAERRYGTRGKTEMWYVLQADAGSGLYVGFKKGVTKEDYQRALAEGGVEQLLEFYPVSPGDVFFIPAGTVHAIGKGVLLAEVQQSSDCTYRVFDWNRVDANGQPRELHVAEALEALHFGGEPEYHIHYIPASNHSVPVIRCNQFNINLLHFTQPLEKVYAGIDSFIIYICTEGRVVLIDEGKEYLLNKGEVMLVPAITTEVQLIPLEESTLMEVFLGN